MDARQMKGLEIAQELSLTKTVKVSYKQDWKNYTIAQNHEVNLFDKLLSDLVKIVPEQPQRMGRPRLSLQETLFCAIQKVYSQLSSRRAYSLYENAEERGDIEKSPCYNVVNILLNREDITPILHKLLAVSALPLKSVETTFAPDSSGFGTSQFGQYAVEKYGGKMKKYRWIKAHILVGTKTNVIASARITKEQGGDCIQFAPMVMEALFGRQSSFKFVCGYGIYVQAGQLHRPKSRPDYVTEPRGPTLKSSIFLLDNLPSSRLCSR